MKPATVGVEYVDDYTHDPCQGPPSFSYKGSHALDFANCMKGRWGSTISFAWGDVNAWETDFRDHAFGGDSFNWSEDVDFCWFGGHGGMSSHINYIYFAAAHSQCFGSSDTWKLGYWKSLKWLVLDCCDGVKDTGSGPDFSVWLGPMQGIHMIFGFVNDTFDSYWNGSLGMDFGSDAAKGAVLANAWLDTAYSFWLGCHPFAIAAGATLDEASQRLEHESIDIPQYLPWYYEYRVDPTNVLACKWRH